MTETNIILKIVRFEYVEPSIAKARKENTTKYIVQTIELPNGDKDSEDDIPF